CEVFCSIEIVADKIHNCFSESHLDTTRLDSLQRSASNHRPNRSRRPTCHRRARGIAASAAKRTVANALKVKGTNRFENLRKTKCAVAFSLKSSIPQVRYPGFHHHTKSFRQESVQPSTVVCIGRGT